MRAATLPMGKSVLRVATGIGDGGKRRSSSSLWTPITGVVMGSDGVDGVGCADMREEGAGLSS